MDNSINIEKLLTLLYKAANEDAPVSLANIRSLALTAPFYAHDGNDHIVLFHEQEFHAFTLTNIVVDDVPNGLGDVIPHNACVSYSDALAPIILTMICDNNLE